MLVITNVINAVLIAHAVTVGALGTVVPLGLAAVDRPLSGRRGLTLGAAAAALLMPPGLAATVLVVPWLLSCSAQALREVVVWLRPGHRSPATLPAVIACAWLVPAALWLVADRLEVQLLGFDRELVAFTVAHFHTVGFGVAALVACLVRLTGLRPGVAACAVLALGGPLVVAAGFLTRDEVNLVGTAMVAAGVVMLSLLTLHEAVPAATPGWPRGLLAVSSYTWLVTMPLAVLYAAAAANAPLAGVDDVSHVVMAAVHGTLNTVAFLVCGLLGWRHVELSSSTRRGVRAHATLA